jgi:hypothetical protein
MYDKLLYQEVRDVPISIIQEKVCKATDISIEEILRPNHYPGARKREYVGARQISMTLSCKFTKLSLAVIGRSHGGRDHATVLHAKKTVNNLIDTKDHDMILNFRRSIELIQEWHSHRIDIPVRLTLKDLIKKRKNLIKELGTINEQINSLLLPKINDKNLLVKFWILHKFPLDQRQKLLVQYVQTKINH